VIVLLMLHFTFSFEGTPSCTLMRRPMANLPSSSAESFAPRQCVVSSSRMTG
jgi:hypothetical protein